MLIFIAPPPPWRFLCLIKSLYGGMFPVCTLYIQYPQFIQYIEHIQYIYIQYIVLLFLCISVYFVLFRFILFDFVLFLIISAIFGTTEGSPRNTHNMVFYFCVFDAERYGFRPRPDTAMLFRLWTNKTTWTYPAVCTAWMPMAWTHMVPRDRSGTLQTEQDK